jgi:predicted negative regulator of RcsB-dependent stress response
MIIPTAAAGAFLKKWWPAIGAALLFGVIITIARCSGESAGQNKEVVKQQGREIETQRDLNDANENAAGDRVEQATQAAQQKKELEDALESETDPDRQRILRGCIILRQQGRDVSDIPACR